MKGMQVMAPQALTAAQAKWKSPNQMCKPLTHNLLLLRSFLHALCLSPVCEPV